MYKINSSGLWNWPVRSARPMQRSHLTDEQCGDTDSSGSDRVPRKCQLVSDKCANLKPNRITSCKAPCSLWLEELHKSQSILRSAENPVRPVHQFLQAVSVASTPSSRCLPLTIFPYPSQPTMDEDESRRVRKLTPERMTQNGKSDLACELCKRCVRLKCAAIPTVNKWTNNAQQTEGQMVTENRRIHQLVCP